MDDLVKDALESKATRSAIVDTAEISFHEEFRKACERNACGQYNSNWMGPPAIGPVAQLISKVRKYKQGLLFQTVHPVSGSFDLEGMREGRKIHEQVFRDLLKKMKNKYDFEDLLPLSAGCCRICPKCAYLDDEPCRHPDEAVSSLEAYGIDVAALEKSAGIPYHNGKNTVSYVGLILFMEKEDTSKRTTGEMRSALHTCHGHWTPKNACSDMKRGFLFGSLSPPNKKITSLRLCGGISILDKNETGYCIVQGYFLAFKYKLAYNNLIN
jgi:predicted metal-binding protein